MLAGVKNKIKIIIIIYWVTSQGGRVLFSQSVIFVYFSVFFSADLGERCSVTPYYSASVQLLLPSVQLLCLSAFSASPYTRGYYRHILEVEYGRCITMIQSFVSVTLDRPSSSLVCHSWPTSFRQVNRLEGGYYIWTHNTRASCEQPRRQSI